VARNRSILRFAIAPILSIALITTCLLATSCPAHGLQTTAPIQPPPQRKFGCQHPANPHRRQQDCNDAVFGLDETLAGGWAPVRRAAQRIGLTPTASYVGALQTNVTSGDHQVWPCAGQLSIAVSADLNELIKATGLSAYVGFSWGTGSNLANSLNSVALTSRLYAPSFTWERCICNRDSWGRR
jgi:hypothetical protein